MCRKAVLCREFVGRLRVRTPCDLLEVGLPVLKSPEYFEEEKVTHISCAVAIAWSCACETGKVCINSETGKAKLICHSTLAFSKAASLIAADPHPTHACLVPAANAQGKKGHIS